MFAASMNARSMIILTCTATAMLTAWIIAAAPVVGRDEGRVRILVGQVRPMGDGTVRSWVRVDAHDRPTAMGVTFTEAALQNLPLTFGPDTSPSRAFSLSLPAEATVRPYSGIIIRCVADRASNASRLGFRFCATESAARDEASDAGASNDVSAPQLTTNIVYGRRDGRFAFVEPTMTKAYLDLHPDETLSIHLPSGIMTGDYAPAECRVKFDSATREYTVSLEGLAKR